MYFFLYFWLLWAFFPPFQPFRCIFTNKKQRKSASSRQEYQQRSVPAPKQPIKISAIFPQIRANTSRSINMAGYNIIARQGPNSWQNGASQNQQTFVEPVEPVPISPGAQSHLIEMIEVCKLQVDFSDPKTMNLRNKKADYLTRILTMTNNLPYFRSLKPEVRDNLFKMLNLTINRKIPQIPLTVIYSDSKVPMPVPNWMHLSIAYKILQSFITNCDPTAIKEYITNDFILALTGLMESPDPQEQVAVEGIIRHIFDCVPGYRQIIFNAMLKELAKYKENKYLYTCVGPTLKFLLYFLRLQPTPLKLPYFNLFKVVIFPLISTQMACDFFPHLNNIAVFFEEKDKEISMWVLDYMLKTWPKTDTDKECSYIVHLCALAPNIPPERLLEAGKKIFGILRKCLLSNNFKVSVAALNVLQNQTFEFTFAGLSNELVPLILAGVNKCSKHWNQNVVKLAIDVARTLLNINSQIANKDVANKVAEMQNTQTTNNMKFWLLISEEAQKNGHECDRQQMIFDLKTKYDNE